MAVPTTHGPGSARARRYPLGYLVAVGLVGLALGLSLVAWPFLHDSAFLLFLVATLFSAAGGGLGPGLVATVLSTLSIHFFFLHPRYTLVLDPESLVRLCVFSLLAVVVSALAAGRRRASEALGDAYGEMEAEVRRRTADLADANRTLSHRARRQAVVAELGQRALAGTDLAQLMEEAVRLVALTLDAAVCQIWELRPDGSAFVQAGPGAPRNGDRRSAADDGEDSFAGYLVRTGAPIVVPDLAAEARFRAPQSLTDAGAVGGASVLIRGYRPFGILGAYATERRELTQEDVDYLQAVANVLATAVERKEGERVSHGQTAALVSTLDTLTARPDLEVFLRQTLAAMAEQLGCPSAALWTYDAGERTFRHHATYRAAQTAGGESAGHLPADPVPPRPGPVWEHMLRTRRPVAIEDVAVDTRLEDRECWVARGVQALMLVPMLLGEEPVGMFTASSPGRRRYRMDEMDLAQALAQQATLALQLTRLAQQSQAAAMVEERNRMAREIHDTLAQGLTGIIIQLEAAEAALLKEPPRARPCIARARDLARESLAEARRSVWALRPQPLEQSGLAAALSRLVGQMTAGVSVRTHFALRGASRPLPPAVEDDLLRIGQEALTNALRHANARQILIELAYEPAAVRLVARDDGSGFDPREAVPGRGLGLTGMRERAGRMGGTLTVRSSPGEGTELMVEVPA